MPGPLLTDLECPDRLQNLMGQTVPPGPSSPCSVRLRALASVLPLLSSQVRVAPTRQPLGVPALRFMPRSESPHPGPPGELEFWTSCFLFGCVSSGQLLPLWAFVSFSVKGRQ